MGVEHYLNPLADTQYRWDYGALKAAHSSIHLNESK